MENKFRKRVMIAITLVISISLLLAACTTPTDTPTAEKPAAPTNTSPPGAAPTEPHPTVVPPTEPPPTQVPPTEPPPTEVPPTEVPTEPPKPALPAEPQSIGFSAEDGQALVGTYFPAAINPAPVVVLMHWAGGDQCDWRVIAPWLQNRSAVFECPAASAGPWLDDTWFPELADDESYAVFAFTFRGCEGGCTDYLPEGWLLDAQAAMKTASELPGIDPARMAAIGASIGADGAVDACGVGCLGALSLSPGNYLKISYTDRVAELGEVDPPIPVRCLAGEGDVESAATCQAASGDHYQAIIYPVGDHGVMLIKQGLDPDTPEVLLEFLRLTLGS